MNTIIPRQLSKRRRRSERRCARGDAEIWVEIVCLMKISISTETREKMNMEMKMTRTMMMEMRMTMMKTMTRVMIVELITVHTTSIIEASNP
jgi:hypothetical protein